MNLPELPVTDSNVTVPGQCDVLKFFNLSELPQPSEEWDMFDFEKLDVYKTSIEWVGMADEIASQLPRGRSYLADQLRRAATSIVLNIAEGAGEYATSEKGRFYRMARRSGAECAAILDVCRQVDVIEAARYAAGRELLIRIVSMLVQMVRRAGDSGAEPDTE